jgi:lipid-A-disaccharide synthase
VAPAAWQAPAVTQTRRNGPRVFISAGEVSGDIVAAHLIRALRAADASVVVDGLGGPRMTEAGATVVAPANHIGAVGVSEGLAMVPSALGVFRAALRHCRAHRPDAAVLIANDVFNVALGRMLRARGIPTIALFPPQTWIWQAVARSIAPSLDIVAASFPDEVRCYGDAGVATEFVGHYLADFLTPVTPGERAAARRLLGLSSDGPVVAVLPGSRRREVRLLLPILLAAADLIRECRPSVQLVVALDGRAGDEIRTPKGERVQVVSDSHMTMRAADVMLSCSGTATLEASLIGIPMVVAYKASWITYKIIRACIRTGLMAGDTVAIPNLLLGHHAVPEFIQGGVTAPAVAGAALPLIDDGEPRRAALTAVRDVRAHVAQAGTLARVARIVLDRAGA